MTQFNVLHIETSDRRDLLNIGKIDVANIHNAFKQYFSLLKVLLFSHADIVYFSICQTPIGFIRDIPLLTLSKLFRKKIVLHLHGGYFRKFYDQSNPFMKFIIRKSLKNVSHIIVLGHSLINIFDEIYPREKISVIPNGLNINPIVNSNEADSEKPIVLFLSNLIKSKGFWDVLYSIKYVVKRFPDVSFIFAGNWTNEKDKIESEILVRKEKIERNTRFLGSIVGTAKIDLLASADIFVFPTYYPLEGHPLVIVEAMASGLPIISTDHAAIGQSVINGKNGLLTEKRNPKQIADKIMLLLEKPDLRQSMGRESKKIYEENFTEEKMIERLASTFIEVLES
ncbi:glycosyltransferase family 4 protein [Acidobacteriota bacterium]